MALRRRALTAAMLAVAVASPAPAAAEEEASPAAQDSLMLPPLARGMTRVHGTVQPFVHLVGPGGGTFMLLAVDHYFKAPWMVGIEASPFALVAEPEGLGAIAHTRLRGAFAADYVEVGLGVGGRFQRYGPSGWSMAPALRLGAIDGLNLRMELGYSLIRNYYTSQAQLAWAHLLGGIDVPVARRLAIMLDGGYGVDLWFYGTVGLRQIVTGRGGPGTLAIGAAFGFVWVVDRFPCQYGDIEPCRGAAWGTGPTIAIRVDRRF